MSERIKIVVIGDYNAGKTTLVHLLDSNARSIEAPTENGTTTVAIDFGRICLDGKEIYLFGTPGQDRFSIVRTIAMHEADGIIIMVDATRGIGEDMAAIGRELTREGIPVVIFLNKVDINPRAREVAKKMEEMVFAVSALTGEGVLPGLRYLLQKITQGDRARQEP